MIQDLSFFSRSFLYLMLESPVLHLRNGLNSVLTLLFSPHRHGMENQFMACSDSRLTVAPPKPPGGDQAPDLYMLEQGLYHRAAGEAIPVV